MVVIPAHADADADAAHCSRKHLVVQKKRTVLKLIHLPTMPDRRRH